MQAPVLAGGSRTSGRTSFPQVPGPQVGWGGIGAQILPVFSLLIYLHQDGSYYLKLLQGIRREVTQLFSVCLRSPHCCYSTSYVSFGTTDRSPCDKYLCFAPPSPPKEGGEDKLSCGL